MARPMLRARGSVFNARTVTAPIAALVMAGLLYTYSVTSIRAAKRNAKLHREADGGQLDMRRESLRRHGVLDKVEGTRDLELLRGARADIKEENKFLTEKKAKKLGEPQLEAGVNRKKIDGSLEGYKGRDGARRIREEKPRPVVDDES